MSDSVELESRERVTSALDGLREHFETVPVRRVRWSQPPGRYERTLDRHRAGTLGGAGTWTTRDDGRVLLVRDESGGPWSEPGGKHERGETLVETAERETREETNVRVAVDGVGVVQHVHQVDASNPDRPVIHRVIPVFTAAPTSDPDAVSTGTDSVVAARWFRERPADLLYDALATLPFPGA